MAEVVAGRRLPGAARSRRAGAPPARAASRTLLWRAEDLIRWGITVGLGGIVIAVAWYVCAGDASFDQQVGPADAAVGGLLLAGIGNAVWLLQGRRALGERRRTLLPDVAAPEPTVTRVTDAGAVPMPAPGETTAQAGLFVAGAGLERYHRPGCALASGRSDWTGMTRAEHEVAGRRPCGVCRP